MRFKDPNGAVFHNSSKVYVHGDNVILSYPEPIFGYVIDIDYDDPEFPIMVKLSGSDRRGWCSVNQCYIIAECIDIMQFEDDELCITVRNQYDIEIILHWMTQQARISNRDYERAHFCTHQQVLFYEAIRRDYVKEGFRVGVTKDGIVRIGTNWDPRKIKSTHKLQILDDLQPNTLWNYFGEMVLITKVTRNGKAYVQSERFKRKLVYQSELKPWKISNTHTL